jgi:hypothetical protein
MKRRITVPLTNSDFQDLLNYEKKFGMREHAQTVRILFLTALRQRLTKANIPLTNSKLVVIGILIALQF